MMATFVIEIGLLLFVLYKYSLKSLTTRLVVATLLCLALFQLAEYNVCGGLGLHAAEWSRFGFIAITLLPPLGLQLVTAISGRAEKAIVRFSYAMAAAWIVVFGFTEWAFRSYECAGNYAIFQMRSPYDTLYLMYYFFWIFVSMLIALQAARGAVNAQRKGLLYMALGYLLFILPTAIVIAVQPSAKAGLPSIMCGFAVLYALALTFGVMKSEQSRGRALKKKPVTKPRKNKTSHRKSAK